MICLHYTTPRWVKRSTYQVLLASHANLFFVVAYCMLHVTQYPHAWHAACRTCLASQMTSERAACSMQHQHAICSMHVPWWWQQSYNPIPGHACTQGHRGSRGGCNGLRPLQTASAPHACMPMARLVGWLVGWLVPCPPGAVVLCRTPGTRGVCCRAGDPLRLPGQPGHRVGRTPTPLQAPLTHRAAVVPPTMLPPEGEHGIRKPLAGTGSTLVVPQCLAPARGEKVTLGARPASQHTRAPPWIRDQHSPTPD